MGLKLLIKLLFEERICDCVIVICDVTEMTTSDKTEMGHDKLHFIEILILH